MAPPVSPSPDPRGKLARLRTYAVDRFSRLRARIIPAPPPVAAAPVGDWEHTFERLFWAGYNGLQEHRLEVSTGLTRLKVSEVGRQQGLARARRSILQCEIDTLLQQHRNEPAELAGLRLTLEGAERERREALEAVGDRRGKLWTVFASLLGKRAAFGVQKLKNRAADESELVAHVAEAVAESDLKRLDAEVRLAASEWTRRAFSQPELDERYAVLQDQVGDARKLVVLQEARAEEARKSGMTARVAGFLVWAGYLGMAVFGWLFGVELQSVMRDGQRLGLVRFLTEEAYATFVLIGFWHSLAAVTVFSSIAFALPVAIVWIYDIVLTRFYGKDWKPDPDESRQQKGEKAKFYGKHSSINPIKSHQPRSVNGRQGRGNKSGSPRSNDQGDLGFNLSWNSILSTLYGNVTRDDYRKHLARIPLLAVPILLGLLALAFIAIQRSEELGGFDDSVDGLMFFVVGIATAAMTCGLMCVLLSRWILQGQPHLRIPRWMSAGLLGIVLVMAVVVTTYHAGIYTLPKRNGAGVFLASALLVANAGVLAFGLIFRNVYYEIEWLRRKVSRAERDRDALIPHKLVGYEDLYPKSLAARWRNLHEKLDGVWLAESGAAGQPVPPVSTAADGAWRDYTLRETSLKVEDLRMAPVEALEVSHARSEYVLALRRLRSASRMVADLLKRITESAGVRPMERILEAQGEAEISEQSSATIIAELERKYAGLHLECESAFLTGVALRDREWTLRNDPLLRLHMVS